MPEYIADGLRWLEAEIAPSEPEPGDEGEDDVGGGGANGEQGGVVDEGAEKRAAPKPGNGLAA